VPLVGQLSLRWLLILIPLSAVLLLLEPLVPRLEFLVFLASAGALAPLAELIGASTEQIAIHAGPRTGGLLNATFANVTELIVCIFLLAHGETAIVKTSLTGAILGNLLLVLGVAFLAGGLRHRFQEYSAPAAGVHSTSLVLAVIGFLMPGLFLLTTGEHSFQQREVVSGWVAIVLIVLYFAALVFTHRNREHLFHRPQAQEHPICSYAYAVWVLVLAAAVIALESELLVTALNPAVRVMGLSKFFVGFVLVPIVGNAAEHSSAVRFALRNKLDVTLEIAIGSSTQIALFVAPALVFISLAVRHPMDFVFTTFEVAAVGVSTLILALISHDGRSNWLEGAQLMAAYLIIAASSFFISL
jgi:Ca2+:H+ antiporter